MHSTYEWNCPFCDAQGKDEWGQQAYYLLHRHLIDEHLEEAYQALLKTHTNKDKIRMVHGNWIYPSYIKEIKKVKVDSIKKETTKKKTKKKGFINMESSI